MADTIDSVLAEYKPEDYSVRILDSMLKIIPGSPAWVHYRSVDDALRAMAPDATAAQYAEARALANDRDLTDVLWMAGLIDTGDKGYAIYTGIASAFNFFFGDKTRGLENDDQQRNDAILKSIAIAYMVYKAYPGTMAEKAAGFRDSVAGRQLAIYYGAGEIALPFSDNVLSSGGNFVSGLINKGMAAQASRLSTMAGGQSMGEAQQMLTNILGSIEQVANTAANYVTPIANAARQYVPAAVAGADKVAGVVASGVDVLPVYRLLGARLAAESVARRALAAA